MLFDHVDLRVANLARCRPLYDAMLPAMGYSKMNADDESVGYHRPGETGAEPFIWLVQEPDHAPNGTRVAFHAASRSDVDRLAALALQNGATNYEPAELVPDYSPYYYAAFFEDAEGNKLEICCRRSV